MQMKKLNIIITAILIMLLILPGCNNTAENEYGKYSDSFFDTFNTMIQVVGYTKSQQEFDLYLERIHLRYQELHKLYNIYNNYEGVNNIKTINDNAGMKPVVVDKEIIDLLLFAKEWYGRTGGKINIAYGPVLKIWHDYRTEGMDFPEEAKIPPLEELQKAVAYTDINQVIVDLEKSTVYLPDSRMRLDVGAIAKGFATELVVREIQEAGLVSGVISAGGNIRTIGKPLDGLRERWAIGIQDPDASIVAEKENILDAVFLTDGAVVSSGDYQRYYIAEGKLLHHIIDPETLMPGDYYRAVTVVADDSGVADFLSTALFLLPFEESRALAESLDGVEALWVMPDGTVNVSEGMKEKLKSYGATNAKSGA